MFSVGVILGRHVSKAVVHVAQWKQGFWVYIGGLRLPSIGFLRQAGFSRSPHTCPGQADRGLQSGKINPEPSRSNPNTLQLGKSEKDRGQLNKLSLIITVLALSNLQNTGTALVEPFGMSVLGS